MKLAVKYRPTSFEEVVGQGLITEILKNQVDNKELTTGYLFSGGSGIGKTTIARILANNVDAEIIEIDGASNNGVENVREIRKNVNHKSISNDYKVYIIDEAHMLSKGAFNALLKTLEEPPEKVIFIMCTTEPEKIPETIHTRVQDFQFNRLNVRQIIKRLEYIVQQEEKNISEDVITYIAKISEGGMRNAISLLEKILDLNDIKLENVIDLVGEINYSDLIDLLNFILVEDKQNSVALIDKLHSEGRNLKLFVKKITEFIVDLTKYAFNRNSDDIFNYINIPKLYRDDLDNLLNNVSNSNKKLGDLFEEFNELHYNIRYEKDPRLLIEGKIMRIC